MSDPWVVNIKGEPGSRYFEISVVRTSNMHGQASYGWFDDNKLLVTHNGGPCSWPLTERVWNKAVTLANEVALELNEDESIVNVDKVNIKGTDYKVLSSLDGWLYVQSDEGDLQFVTTNGSPAADCPAAELIERAKNETS